MRLFKSLTLAGAALILATAPALASDRYPDRPGLHFAAGSPPSEVGACMIDLMGWFAYLESTNEPIEPWLRQMFSAFEREAARTKVGLDAAMAGAQAETARVHAVRDSQGARAMAQDFADRVQTCSHYVTED